MELIYTRHNKNKKCNKINQGLISFNELTFILKGTVTYKINNSLITLNEGDAIFIKQNNLRERVESKENVDYISFNYINDDSFNFPIKIDNILSNEILSLIRSFEEIYSNKYINKSKQLSLLLECILIQMREQIDTKNINPLVMKIIIFLKENLKNNLTLETIGKLTNFSPIYCDSVFKKETGKSIISYFLDLKINKAKELILESSLSLKEISTYLSFNDYNYFSRLFKSRVGYSPLQYKKIYNKE